MASPKRPTLAQSGIDKLFEASGTPEALSAAPATPSPTFPGNTTPRGSWEATHHRRTFHCDNAVWGRLVAWCRETGMSHSATIEQALEAFLADRGR